MSIHGNMTEPSTLSSDPNERKTARRFRIQRRLEVLTKQVGIQDEVVIEKTAIERQMLESTDTLEKLATEGNEVVSCVRVANDARELQRRKEEQETNDRLLKKLEEEDKECMEKYHEIAKKWPDILLSKDPLDIHVEMVAQSTKCLEVLAKKDSLIAELQEELENADLRFANDQKQQREEIDVLIERIENQVNTMGKAYNRELVLIDDVIELERKMLLEIATEKWETLYKKLEDENREGKEKRKQIMREYEEEMDKVIMEHQEEFRAQKISFELEIQNLKQEMQNMKALCIMNIEKLDYNYAVIKCQEEENIIVKNQQKRQINKLQDVISNLKKNYAELERSTRLDIQKLTDQILKARKDILHLKKKSDSLAAINDRKYMEIWDMNIKNANELLEKIFTADKIIHEQLLGFEWQPPEQQLLKKEDLRSYCAAMCVLKEAKERTAKRRIISKSYKEPTTTEEMNLERRLLNHIIKHISNQCGYFVESSLNNLLSNYAENDKLVIRLDNVFQALNVNSEKELQFLLNYFLPYAYCPICTTKTSTPSVGDKSEENSLSELVCLPPDIYENSEELHTEEAKLIAALEEAVHSEKLQNDNDVCTRSDTSQTSSSKTSNSNVAIISTCVSDVIEIADDNGEPKRQLTCDQGHLLEIETAFVLTAVKEFIERCEFVRYEKMLPQFGEMIQKEKASVSRNITANDITEFWKRYRDIFPKDQERLWDVLIIGLKQYYNALKERFQLNVETESLRKQNAELYCLLKSYTTELEYDELH